jgi:hypothetical protein
MEQRDHATCFLLRHFRGVLGVEDGVDPSSEDFLFFVRHCFDMLILEGVLAWGQNSNIDIHQANTVNTNHDCGKLWDKKNCEMDRPLMPVEHKRIKEGIPRETVLQESFWRMRTDGIAVLPPTGNKAGTFCILEHKRMSDCCEHYLVRAKNTTENQYASLRSAISTVIQRQSWKVDQVSFITGARSVDKQDFRNNMKFFGVSEASISSIYSKLAMRTFDVYVNILKCMYRMLSVMSGLASNPANREIASSSGRRSTKTFFSSIFFQFFFSFIFSKKT